MLKAIKERIKTFFYFTSSEANGLCCLILLIFLFIIAPRAWQVYAILSAKKVDNSKDIALLESYFHILQANKVKLLDINTATVQQLSAIKGISQKLASTMIRYRNKLGGFVSVNQYKEIYGLTDSLQAILRKETMVTAKYRPKQLSLNRATFQELIAHPYISFASAKAIVGYRQQQGKFSTLAVLETLPGCHSDWAKKITPYLSLL